MSNQIEDRVTGVEKRMKTLYSRNVDYEIMFNKNEKD